eukprot:GDKI01006373.1.p1 GENE.GDKI01006373.1~~GDKI01006373.1.p1  ORF type:complete len:947 (+),score=294.49 GDKI01006373.1:190-3030(+)
MVKVQVLGALFATVLAANMQSANAIKCAVSLPGGKVMATDFGVYQKDANGQIKTPLVNISPIDKCAKFTATCTEASTEFYCQGKTGSVTVYGAVATANCKAGWTCTANDWSNKPASWTGTGTKDVYMGTGFDAPQEVTVPSALLDTGKFIRYQVQCDSSVFGCTADEQATNVLRWFYGAVDDDVITANADPNLVVTIGNFVSSYSACTDLLCNGQIFPPRLKCYAGASEADDASATTYGPSAYSYNVCQAGQACKFVEACQKFQLQCSDDYATLTTSNGQSVKFCNQNEIVNKVYKWVYSATSWEQCAQYTNSPPAGLRNNQCCTGALCNTPEYPKPITCWNGNEFKLFEVTKPLLDWSEKAYDSCVGLRFSCAKTTDETLLALQDTGCTDEQKLVGALGGQFGAINKDKCAYLKEAHADPNTGLDQIYSKIECCDTDRCNGPKDFPPVMCWNGKENKIFTNTQLFDQADAKSKCMKYQLDCDKAVTGMPGKEECTKPTGSGQKVWVYGSAPPATCTTLTTQGNPLGIVATTAKCCDGTDTTSCNEPPSFDPISCYSDALNAPKVFLNEHVNDVDADRYTQCVDFKINCKDPNLYAGFKSYCTASTQDYWVHGAMTKGMCEAVTGLEGSDGVYPGTTACCTPASKGEVCNGPKDYPPLSCFDGKTAVLYDNKQKLTSAMAINECFKGRVMCDTTDATGVKLAALAGCGANDEFKWIYGASSVENGKCETYSALSNVFVEGTFSCCSEDGCNSAEPLTCAEGFGDEDTFPLTGEIKVDSSDVNKDRCYRYRIVCTFGDVRCTEEEQKIGKVKYVAGATDANTCAMMASLPSTYHNLLCCQMDKCNAPTNFKLSCTEGSEDGTLTQTNSAAWKSGSTVCYSHGMDGAKTYGFTNEAACQGFVKSGKSNVQCCTEDCYAYELSAYNNEEEVSAGNRRRSLLGDVMAWFA